MEHNKIICLVANKIFDAENPIQCISFESKLYAKNQKFETNHKVVSQLLK